MDKTEYQHLKRLGWALWTERARLLLPKSVSEDGTPPNLRFFTGQLSPVATEALQRLFEGPATPYSNDDTSERFVHSDYMDEAMTVRYVAENTFHHPRDRAGEEEAAADFAAIMADLYPRILAETGCHWRVVNTLTIAPNATARFGQYEWHVDGFPACFRKILVFAQPISPETGTTEIRLPDGSVKSLDGPAGSWAFLDINTVEHRGVPPRQGTRPVLQITIACDVAPVLDYVDHGLNAHYPLLPPDCDPATAPESSTASAVSDYLHWHAEEIGKRYTSYRKTFDILKKNADENPVNLNIGGGHDFLHVGWINLENIFSSRNPLPFQLEPGRPFPLKADSIERVYWSHNIEHLWPETVEWVLSEVQRVLRKDGQLVLKLPNYDRVLDHWRRNDTRMMFDPYSWAFHTITPSWSACGIPDDLLYRSATVFVQWQTESWGKPQAVYLNAGDNAAPQAYHGPPRMAPAEIEALFRTGSPKKIAEEMRSYVLQTEKNPFLHHVCAWGTEELKDMLSGYGFRDFGLDRETIVKMHGDIPTIDGNYNISTFLTATQAKAS